jgi:hypothetical protein
MDSTKLKEIIMNNKETLEEVAERIYLSHENNELLYSHSEDLQLAYKAGIVDGVKWQAERMYSEEEVYKLLLKHQSDYRSHVRNTNDWSFNIDNWFKQFKKK